ncbi:Uncharacterised protein [Burkholderia pseudomallei]|nr:Uncharacterised protein [Burkholderia pseudomallei]CFM33947.1 Uncharacterised protein [Burkholderia pseudomallei]CFM42758.1 Uncharacterised protein [Burkholderia pseudomallei]CFM68009.1 Uncharacterised protein [Burkholderia pseudomallei]CFM88771.1 Uncharacterised protein [Burkholderia pseudomallei]
MRPVPAPEPPAPPDAQPAQTNTARRVATSIFIGTNFVEQRRVAVARRSIIGRRILRASPSHAQQAGSGELASGHSTFRPFDLSTFRPFDHRPSTIDIDHRPSGFGLRASGFGLRASGFGLRASGILPFSHLTARRLRPPRPVQSAPSPIAHQPDPHRPSPEFVRAPRMSREPRPTMNRKPKPKPRRREPAPRPSPTPGPQPQPAQKATTSRAAAGAPINLGTHSIFQRTAKHRTRYAPTLESSPCSEVRPCPLPIATTISPA